MHAFCISFLRLGLSILFQIRIVTCVVYCCSYKLLDIDLNVLFRFHACIIIYRGCLLDLLVVCLAHCLLKVCLAGVTCFAKCRCTVCVVVCVTKQLF